MKKTVSLILSIVLLTACFVLLSSAAGKMGDVNGDGKVTAADARLVLRHAASLEMLSNLYITNADADGNGKITAADARLILRVSAGLEQFTEQDNTTEEPTTEVTEEPTSETTEEPTSETAEEPTSERAEEPTSEAIKEPTSEATEEPTSEATEEPTSEAIKEPTSEAIEEPLAYADEILKVYRDEANNFKSTVASYNITQYNKLLETDLDEDSELLETIKAVFLVDEEDAFSYESDYNDILPLWWSDSCCELFDADTIESASIIDEDGKTTVSITLKPETNPVEPFQYDSFSYSETEVDKDKVGYTFKMFDSRAAMYVSAMKFAADYTGIALSEPEYIYSGCTATLVFDSETHAIESLEHVVHVKISADITADGVTSRNYIDVESCTKIDNARYSRVSPPYYSADAEVRTGADVILPADVEALLTQDGPYYMKGSVYGSDIEVAIDSDVAYMIETIDEDLAIGVFVDGEKTYIVNPQRKTYAELTKRALKQLGFEDLSFTSIFEEEYVLTGVTSYTYTVDEDVYEKFIFESDGGSTLEVGCLNGTITYIAENYSDENADSFLVFVDEYSQEIPAHMLSPTAGYRKLTFTLFLADMNWFSMDGIFW